MIRMENLFTADHTGIRFLLVFTGNYGKDGKVTNAFIYNDNGLLISEGIVDEAGNRNGKWKDLYPNGKVQAEGQYH